MSTLIVATGPCCVGKSTFIDQALQCEAYKDYHLIRPESYYKKINGDESNRTGRERIWLSIWEDIMHFMELGENVIVGANAPTECARTQYLEWFRGFDKRVLWEFNAGYAIVARHNICRIERQLSKDELIRQYRNFEFPENDRHIVDWDEYRLYEYIKEWKVHLREVICRGELVYFCEGSEKSFVDDSRVCNHDDDDITNPCWDCKYFVFPIGCMKGDVE